MSETFLNDKTEDQTNICHEIYEYSDQKTKIALHKKYLL